jgi:hypothetical protein
LVLVESREGTLEIIDQGVSLPGFHDHIIDVGSTRSSLISSARHCWIARWYVAPTFLSPNNIVVAVGVERCNEGRLDLIILVESDLLITRVAIEKGQ